MLCLAELLSNCREFEPGRLEPDDAPHSPSAAFAQFARKSMKAVNVMIV